MIWRVVSRTFQFEDSNSVYHRVWCQDISKHYTNILVLKSAYFALFNSYLTYSILNHGRAKKTTLLPLTRLQNKSVRTLEYIQDKSKTTLLYSKHKILSTPDLCRLLVAKLMCSFDYRGLPNHFDNYFTEIASVHNCQTSLASLQKYYLPRMKTFLGQLSVQVYWPQNLVWYSWNFEISLSLFISKIIQKRRAMLPKFLFIIVHMTVTFL